MKVVIELKGHQYLVGEGDVFYSERVPVEAGAEFAPDRVLAVLEPKVEIGRPAVQSVRVTLQSLGEEKAPKIRAIRFKPRTGLKKIRGHRQLYTRVKVVRIEEVKNNGA